MSETEAQAPPAKHYTAKELYALYRASLIPVISVNADGNQGIGSAFHVGGGAFVTARHVVEGMVSCHIDIDNHWLMQRAGESAKVTECHDHHPPMPIDPRLHPDPNKDVAVFSVPSLACLSAIPLDGHLDDWITDHDFVLNEVLVLGFPRIPLSRNNILVASRAQISAVVDLINVKHVHFVVSAMARGGFSGGVVISEWGFALGVVTSSLLKDSAPEELGFLTVLTVEPVLECLGVHSLLPIDLAVQWDGLFTAKTEHFGAPEKGWAHSWIETDRDGHRARISFATPDENVRGQMADALVTLPGFNGETELVGMAKHVWEYNGDYALSETSLEEARAVLSTILLAQGYLPVDRPTIMTGSLDVPPLVDLLKGVDSSEE